MTARIDRVVTSGHFALDGGSWEVDNNVWLIGDDAEVIVIDAAHDTDAIMDAVDGRAVLAIVLTHAHNDHINAAVELGRESGAEVWFPPADRMLWDAEHDTPPDRELHSGATFTVAGTVLRALPTPGHTPGSMCLYVKELGRVFTGDTLFAGGPGATGRSYSDFDTIIDSIRERLLKLPDETVVHTGHGDDTTIGAEAPHLDEWIARGA
jgi:glyoxylase-like metal-dependent hydrolase (beta-lactamase superfamily II)